MADKKITPKNPETTPAASDESKSTETRNTARVAKRTAARVAKRTAARTVARRPI